MSFISFHLILQGAKKVVKASTFSWDTYKALPLSLLATVTTSGVWGLWPLATPEEDFGSMLFKTCMTVVEGEGFSKFEEKACVFTVLVEVIKKFQVLFSFYNKLFMSALYSCFYFIFKYAYEF